MEKFIKYKRIYVYDVATIPETFDDLIKEGWEIIHYQETPRTDYVNNAIIICGKKQEVF